MRTIVLTATLGAMLASLPAAAQPGLSGHYRLTAGPDMTGELEIAADHRFRYAFGGGALDEQAAGRWVQQGAKACLYTEPRPVAPQFTLMPRSAPSDEAATLLVKWPNGRGAALVDFIIGFDSGEALSGYTQDYGWTMPQDDSRVPRWIELAVPMHGVKSQRLMLDAQARGTINVLLTPNDLGVVDFQGACLEARGDAFFLPRLGGEMRFVRAGD